VHLNSNADVSNVDCGVITNSSSGSGLSLSNNATISGPVRVHGDISLSNGATLTGTPIVTNAAPVADGYAGVTVLTPPACTAQSGSAGGTRTLTAGHFCSGWSFGNGANITLGAGVYYVDSQFALGNNVTITGTSGVTIVLNGSYAIAYGTGIVMNLVAPTTGHYAGLVLFSPATNSSALTQDFKNNASLTFIGALYLPSQTLNFSNNVVVQSTACTQIIARLINISNNVNLKNSCAGTGVVPVGSSISTLVE
jgi:hypothetical protein